MYELYYRSGGHVGPYETLEVAIEAAKRKVNENERYIMIMDKTTREMVGKVYKEGYIIIEEVKP